MEAGLKPSLQAPRAGLKPCATVSAGRAKALRYSPAGRLKPCATRGAKGRRRAWMRPVAQPFGDGEYVA